MSKHTKALAKLCAVPPASGIKWEEMASVLQHLGYKLLKPSKTGGSARKFFHEEKKLLICCHAPHPSPDVDKGCIADVANHLRTNGFI